MSITNNPNNTIEKLIQEIFEYEQFLNLINQHKNAKAVELARTIANNDNYKTTLPGRKRRKIYKILERNEGKRLSQNTLKYICNAVDYVMVSTISLISLHSLLLSELLTHSSIDTNSESFDFPITKNTDQDEQEPPLQNPESQYPKVHDSLH